MVREKNITSKVKQNKKKKEDELFTAAYELFTTKGANNTAIDEIVKRAGVAKGTFYLYFKDKYDIVNRLILQKSGQVAKEAMIKTEEKGIESFEEQTIFFIDCMLNKEKEEKGNEIEEVAKFFVNKLMEQNMAKLEAELTLFMIFELVGSVCYSSIILGEPADIDTIKPVLFKKVLAML